MMKFQPSKLALLCSTAMMMSFAYAEDSKTNETADDSSKLEEIVVLDTPFSQQIGTQQISEKEIARRPSTNTTITGLLKNNVNVRFSNKSELSTNGGEIKPDDVSFHGEKFYNNNFIIDGMSNNDNMNPASSTKDTLETGASITMLPSGNSQSFWIDTSVLKNVEVFDSNISAKYGNFTGGVINAELKDPDLEKGNTGKVYYRTTRDNWAKFHVDDSDTFFKAEQLDDQPEYVKKQYGFVMSQKVNDKLGFIVSYDRTMSDIKFYHSNLKKRDASGNYINQRFSDTQKLRNETLLVRGVYLPDNGDLWRSTFMYSPHTAKRYAKNVLNGAYTSTGGGLQASLEWEKQFDWLKMKSYVGYKYTQNEVEYEADSYHRYMPTSSINWISTSGYSMLGGTGAHETEKGIITLKQDYEAKEFDLGTTSHKLSFGWDVDIAQAAYNRPNNNTQLYYAASNKVICNGDSACIDGEQYAFNEQTLVKRSVKVSDTTYAAYAQDVMKWKNLEFSAGLRIDHNRFFGRTNFAPRLSASYDVFGDQSTRIFTGLNRYYAGSMLKYKLTQGIGSAIRRNRELNADGTLGAWSDYRYVSQTYYNTSELEVPYSDEITLGATQKLLGANWTLKWVHRNGRNQLTQTSQKINGTTYTVLGNGGWSKNDNISLTISPMKEMKFKYAEIGWNVGVSYNKSRTNNSYYDREEDSSRTMAIYRGGLVNTNALPANDFNDPLKAVVAINTFFPAINLSWDQRFTWLKEYDYIESDGSIHCAGTNTIATYRAACGSYGQGNPEEVSLYKDVTTGGDVLVDWRFTYKQPTFQNQFFEITLDINNVLNKKALAKTASGTSVYKMGRNYWLSASYNW